MVAKQTFTAELIQAAELSSNARSLVFDPVYDTSILWQPGQHVQILHPTDSSVRIPLSLASPHDAMHPGRFEVAVVRSDNFLQELKLGDHVQVHGPSGKFLRRDFGTPAAFIAVGTGLAPLRAMLLEELQSRPRDQVSLILLFGARTQTDLLWYEQLSTLAQRHPRFEYVPTLSRGEAAWAGRRGYVQQHLQEVVGPVNPRYVYLCGSSAMVEECTKLLDRELGLGQDRLIFEQYG